MAENQWLYKLSLRMENNSNSESLLLRIQKWHSLFGKHFDRFYLKLKIPLCPAIPFLDIYQIKMKIFKYTQNVCRYF